MATPEGKIKSYLNKRLAEVFGARCYRFMPVQMGYGASTLDYLLCVSGYFVGIETKAPGKKLTSRQEVVMMQIQKAGGKVYVVSSKEQADEVVDKLSWLPGVYAAPRSGFPEANGD
jgi:stalled ribosome rescue protein Dom34